MPRNNGTLRREERKRDAEARRVAGNESGKTVAERAAERGKTHTPKAERKGA